MKAIFFSAAILGVSLAAVSLTREAPAGEKREASFQSLFDGQTLKGWHASAQTGHSRASGNKSGGRWIVENGAIVGSQDIPGNDIPTRAASLCKSTVVAISPSSSSVTGTSG